jgi:hypothetical protein
LENLKARDLLVDIGVAGMVVLKHVLMKEGGEGCELD